jgi:hypothetical protein
MTMSPSLKVGKSLTSTALTELPMLHRRKRVGRHRPVVLPVPPASVGVGIAAAAGDQVVVPVVPAVGEAAVRSKRRN